MNKSNVIDFEKVKLWFELQKFKEYGHVSSYLEKADESSNVFRSSQTYTEIQQHLLMREIHNKSTLLDELIYEYEILEINSRTNNTMFKFPTTYSNLNTNVNPATAYYLSLQKALFCYEVNVEKNRWIIERLMDDVFFYSITDALGDDISKLNILYEKYIHAHHLKPVLHSIKQEIQEKTLYIKVFTNLRNDYSSLGL